MTETGVRVGGVAMVWWSCKFLFGGLGLAQDRDVNFYFFTCFLTAIVVERFRLPL